MTQCMTSYLGKSTSMLQNFCFEKKKKTPLVRAHLRTNIASKKYSNSVSHMLHVRMRVRAMTANN